MGGPGIPMMSSSAPKARSRGEEVDLRTRVPPKNIAIGAVALFTLLWLSGFISFGSSNGSSEVYSVMIDAGSTGSRIHAYHFERSRGGPILKKELFEQLKPGLSSFKSDPAGGARSLMPLLSSAKNYVPESLHSVTPILLKATAGLRMLKTEEADSLLQESRDLLGKSGFKFAASNGVEIMDGLSEAKFAWVTINYLSSRLSSDWRQTAVMLDLGGGSTQIAMDIGTGKGSVAPREDIEALRLMGTAHRLYLHSFLGYGLMAGRAGTFAAGAKLNGADGAEACIPNGGHAEFSYNDKQWSVQGKGTGGSDECSVLVDSHLEAGAFGKGQPTPESTQPIYAMSYYFDRAVDAGLISSDVQEGVVSVEQYSVAARRACSLDMPGIKKSFPNVKDGDAPFLCMDLCFITQLLKKGFHIPSTTTLHLAKSMQFNGERVETQWTLGAALQEIV